MTYQTSPGVLCRRQVRRQRRLEPERGGQDRKVQYHVSHHFAPLNVGGNDKVASHSLQCNQNQRCECEGRHVRVHRAGSAHRMPGEREQAVSYGRTAHLSATLTYHSSREVTQRMLCSLSNIVCRLVNIDRYSLMGNGPFRRGSC